LSAPKFPLRSLLVGFSLLLLTGVAWLLYSPWWLRPHAPLAQAEAVVVEGYLSAASLDRVAAYLAAHPTLQVLTTGANRTVMVYQTHTPGTLRWRLDTAGFQPDAQAGPPGVRLKGHSKGCRDQSCTWTVQVNGNTLFDGEMPSYEPRSFRRRGDARQEPVQEVAIRFGHPDPDSSCRWVIWHLFVEGMAAAPQRITYEPEDHQQPTRTLPSTVGETGREALIARGIDPQRIEVVPPQLSHQLRTYHAALGLPGFLAGNHPQLRRLNLISGEFHARRSWESYRRALRGTEVRIGVINPGRGGKWVETGQEKWWESERGKQDFQTQLYKYLGWRWWRLGH